MKRLELTSYTQEDAKQRAFDEGVHVVFDATPS